MSQASADRKYAAEHDKAAYHNGRFSGWGKDPSDGRPFHYRDGVRIWVADVDYSPDDHFI